MSGYSFIRASPTSSVGDHQDLQVQAQCWNERVFCVNVRYDGFPDRGDDRISFVVEHQIVGVQPDDLAVPSCYGHPVIA